MRYMLGISGSLSSPPCPPSSEREPDDAVEVTNIAKNHRTVQSGSNLRLEAEKQGRYRLNQRVPSGCLATDDAGEAASYANVDYT